MLLLMLFLTGCSSFCFGSKDKEARIDDVKKAEKFADVKISQEEYIDFRKKTDHKYEGIIFNNRSIIPRSLLDNTVTTTEQWLELQPHLNHHMYQDVQNILNPQADAQKYINLLLSLLTDGKIYQAIILESKEQAPFFPGNYIFINRQEIENCQDEAILAEILSFRLVRNIYLNNNINYSLFDKSDIRKSITNLIQKDRDKWDKYALDSENKLNKKVTDQVAVLMLRAGFKPSFAFTLDELPGFHKSRRHPDKNLEFIEPLKRHKKVFD